MICIYKFVSPSNKVYVGQTIDLKRRLRHYSALQCKAQSKLYNSFVKYGFDNHSFSVLQALPKDVSFEVMNQLEIAYFEIYKAAGYNMLNLRFPGNNGRHSEETKEKLRKWNLGRKMPPGTGQKVADKLKGVKLSSERRKSISDGHRGIAFSDSHKNKIAEKTRDRMSKLTIQQRKEISDRLLKSREGKPSPKKGVKLNKPVWNRGVTGYTTKWKGGKTKKTLLKLALASNYN